MRNRRSTDWLGVSSQSVRIVQMLVRESQFSHGFRLQQGHGKVGAEGEKTAAGKGEEGLDMDGTGGGDG